ncbi:hypothetical protein AB5J72_48590 [Streptomyces sp. CG1]|uniref:hypothetical protein n=1 Tax=Streptomyces sp. CG1 TaxID=1287523 RepID=UPI0034E1B223
MNDADRKAFLTRHDIDTITVTDENGATQHLLDEDGMRRLADIVPIGPAAAHALVDRWLATARGQDTEQ